MVTKEVVVAWKETLAKRYAVSTVNGKLAALNGLFSFLGWRECRVKPLRRQRELFRDKGRELDKGEYLALLAAAKVAQRPTEDGDRALVDSFLAEVGEQA